MCGYLNLKNPLKMQHFKFNFSALGNLYLKSKCVSMRLQVFQVLKISMQKRCVLLRCEEIDV